MGNKHLLWIVLLQAFCLTSFAHTHIDGCPDVPGENIAAMLFENTCYYLHTKKLVTFDEAFVECSAYQGKLIMPKTESISHTLETQIKAAFVTKGGAWVGFIHEERDGETKFYWAGGERVDSKHARSVLKYADALIFEVKNRTLYLPNDGTKNHFVCEIKANIMGDNSTSTPNVEDCLCPDLRTGQKRNMRFFGDVCYLFQLEFESSYERAKSYCEHYGGTLAMPKTHVTEEFLQHTLHDDFDAPRYSVWIGLETTHDGSNRQHYLWADGSQVTYTNFRYTFPVHRGMYTMSGLDYKWQSYSRKSRCRFICQFKSVVNSKCGQCGRH